MILELLRLQDFEKKKNNLPEKIHAHYCKNNIDWLTFLKYIDENLATRPPFWIECAVKSKLNRAGTLSYITFVILWILWIRVCALIFVCRRYFPYLISFFLTNQKSSIMVASSSETWKEEEAKNKNKAKVHFGICHIVSKNILSCSVWIETILSRCLCQQFIFLTSRERYDNITREYLKKGCNSRELYSALFFLYKLHCKMWPGALA